MDHEMQAWPLDSETAERMLAGRVPPEDAPPGYGSVVRLLDAASAETGVEALERERDRELVAAFALAVSLSGARRTTSGPSQVSHARLVAATFAAALGTSAALAATGSLPDAVHQIASTLLDKVGISVPGPSDSAGTPVDGDATPDAAPTVPSVSGTRRPLPKLRRMAETTGVEKRAVLPAAASDGRVEAEQDGSAGPSFDIQDESATASTAPSAAGGSESSEQAPSAGGKVAGQAKGAETTGVEKGAAVSPAASKGGQMSAHATGVEAIGVQKAASSPPGSKGEGQIGRRDRASGVGNENAPGARSGGGPGAVEAERGRGSAGGGSPGAQASAGSHRVGPADAPGAKPDRGGSGTGPADAPARTSRRP